MKTLAIITVFACLIIKATAQSALYGQCGGIGWTGSTTCVAGATCTELNSYYFQCLPGSTTSSLTTITPPPTPPPTFPPPVTTTPTTTTPTTTPPATTTSTGATPTGSQIRSDQDPVYHLYLQEEDGQPMLGPEASSGYFTITTTISVPSSTGSLLYLNVGNATTSYVPLSLDPVATTTDWGLEGDTIITTNPRQLNFLACNSTNPNYFTLYLQNGNDMPSTACSLISLHLDCLC